MQGLSPVEKQYGMTTGESGQSIDPSSDQYQGQESPSTKKKSMIGKVKDKAKKLKTKIKNKKPGSGNGDTSSSGEEESDQSPQTPEPHALKADTPSGNKGRGIEDEKHQPTPEPTPGTDSLQDRMGGLNLEAQPHTKPQGDIPTATGQPSAGSSGMTSYLASSPPVEEGRDSQGRDLVADQSASKGDDAVPGIAGAAGTLGVGAAAAEHESAESPSDESKPPPLTTRAANAVMGYKDAVASKLGYGAGSPTTTQPDGTPKSYVQIIQETAAGGKDAVLGKLGYGEAKSAAPGEGDATPGTDQQKSYLQMAQESAYGAKDAVASKLGYNSGPNQGKDLNEAKDLGEDVAPSRFHPGLEDKALSQIITDAMSTSATSVKNTVLSPFSGSKPTTPSADAPPASSAPSEGAAI